MNQNGDISPSDGRVSIQIIGWDTDMIASTQITNTEILGFIAVLVFKLLTRFRF